MEGLKPCPFCGGDADVVDLNDTEGVRVAGFRFAVRCTICGATLECRSAIQSKIAWNRRYDEFEAIKMAAVAMLEESRAFGKAMEESSRLLLAKDV